MYSGEEPDAQPLSESDSDDVTVDEEQDKEASEFVESLR